MISSPQANTAFAPLHYPAQIINDLTDITEDLPKDFLNINSLNVEDLPEAKPDWSLVTEETKAKAANVSADPDDTRTLPQLIEAYGCQYEEHSVTTSDGYHLKLFRVNSGAVSKSKKPVFVQHGLFSDADTWCLHKDKSLAFRVAKAGYDVWLGNNRGNKYCLTADHSSPTKSPEKFYDYSFFELGKYDAPAQIDYVLSHTGYKKVSYIGHSQGTSQMFAALAFNFGNLNDKLEVFIACAPIVNLRNSPNDLMQNAAKYWRQILPVMHTFGFYAVGATPKQDDKLKSFCRIFGFFCDAITNFANLTPSQWEDPTIVAVDNARTGSWASIKQIVHYGQIFHTGIFKEYDYGSDKKNEAVYGNRIIPTIPIRQITKVPIAYFVGKHDDLGDPTDTAYTYKIIPATFKYNLYDDMDHYSFQVGADMGYVDDVLTILSEYATGQPEVSVESSLY